MNLPSDASARKALPIATGVIDYFPDCWAEIAALSKAGNDQHNPGKPLHWDRSKSGDESDALMRHFIQRGTRDSDGIRHSAKVAWRALAALQKEIEAECQGVEEHHAVEAPMPPTVDFVVRANNPVGGDFNVKTASAPAGPHSFKVGDRVVANGYSFGPQRGVITRRYHKDCWAVLLDESPSGAHGRTDGGGDGWTYRSNQLTPLLDSTDVPLIQN